jgi:predicted glycogen debranching enzyme
MGEHSRRHGGGPVQVGFAAELVLAADTFVITPVARIADGARARAEGDEIRTVIAGYHWFTDWGRDTMISLEGLTLTSGRAIEARWILRTFAHYLRDGLIPNLFPEGQNQGLYQPLMRRCGSFTHCTAMSSIAEIKRPWRSCYRS